MFWKKFHLKIHPNFFIWAILPFILSFTVWASRCGGLPSLLSGSVPAIIWTLSCRPWWCISYRCVGLLWVGFLWVGYETGEGLDARLCWCCDLVNFCLERDSNRVFEWQSTWIWSHALNCSATTAVFSIMLIRNKNE